MSSWFHFLYMGGSVHKASLSNLPSSTARTMLALVAAPHRSGLDMPVALYRYLVDHVVWTREIVYNECLTPIYPSSVDGSTEKFATSGKMSGSHSGTTCKEGRTRLNGQMLHKSSRVMHQHQILCGCEANQHSAPTT